MDVKSIFGGKKIAAEFMKRYQKHFDEMKWLFFELYPHQEEYFKMMSNQLYDYYRQRANDLKKLDLKREKNPDWYKKNNLLGMMMYTEAFAGNLQGVKEHIDYLKKSNVNYLHLMPLLDTTEGKSDGGYAVSDYRKVQPALGNMDDLEALTKECHNRDMCVCLDYVMNHTSEDHEWARRARAGEREYKDRYYFYDDYSIPEQFEKTVPQVFPKTAPGNFTYLEDCGQFVMTSFYPYQWDLNYWNPVVFNEMMYNFLFLANKGIDVIRIDAVPYIWKELGTNCRNLPKVHNIVRLMRMIGEIVCPGVLLLGEVVMEPKELAPYFGTVEKPECHLLYNVTTMATVWHTVATKDVRLLRRQMDIIGSLPKEYSFLNYLRCHDDIGWGLDYHSLREWGMDEVPHKKYLNDYFLGNIPESTSTGELYNADPVTGDARFCATTASMCGIERGRFEQNEAKIQRGIDLDLMLHAFLLFQSGIPVIYSGDEIAAENDWYYKQDPLKVDDSRYIHRGKFQWEKVECLKDKSTPEYRVYHGIEGIEKRRFKDSIFNADADVYTIETHNNAVLGMLRMNAKKYAIGLFNFSDQEQQVEIWELKDKNMILRPYEYQWIILEK